MFAEFIDRPLSGEFPEIHFGRTTPNCAWVKFTDENYQDWVGSFQKGWSGYGTFIVVPYKSKVAFVVAGGNGFLINISNKQLLTEHQPEEIKSVILNGNQNKIYFSNGFDLQSVDLEGNLSVLFDNYYFENIELVEVIDNCLYAKYRDERLQINLETKEVRGVNYDVSKQVYATVVPKPSFIKKVMMWIKG